MKGSKIAERIDMEYRHEQYIKQKMLEKKKAEEEKRDSSHRQE